VLLARFTPAGLPNPAGQPLALVIQGEQIVAAGSRQHFTERPAKMGAQSELQNAMPAVQLHHISYIPS
jgi:hypothetical protein